MVPDEVLAYGDEVAARLHDVLGERFVGAWFVGSVALGGYVPDHSDIDIVSVAVTPPAPAEAAEIVARLEHPGLRCPTRGFEFVLYEHRRVKAAEPGTAFEINLNSGPRMTPHVGVDASREPRFWFIVDRAIAHLHGVTIEGPAPSEVFAPMPREWVLEALAESISWHRTHETVGPSSVLNACRAWRYAEDGTLSSKDEGAAWAAPRWSDEKLIASAVRARHGSPGDLAEAPINDLLDHVEHVLAEADP